MLRVCFPWSQENLSPWYTSCYEFPRPQPTHQTPAGLVTKAQARAWWWNRHSVDLINEPICQVLITASSFYLSQDVPLIMDLGFDVPSQKKHFALRQLCVCWNNVPKNQLNSGHSLFFHNAFSGWSFLCFLMKGVFWLCAQQILLANPAKYEGEIS